MRRRYDLITTGALLVGAILLVAGAVGAGVRLRAYPGEAVTAIDGAGTLTQLVLPLVSAVVAAWTVGDEERHRPLLPARPVGWRMGRTATTLLPVIVVPAVITAAIIAITRDVGADGASVASYTAGQCLGAALAVLVGLLLPRVTRSVFAVPVAAVVCLIVLTLARSILPVLGATTSLVGTTPRTMTVVLASAVSTGVVIALAALTASGARGRRAVAGLGVACLAAVGGGLLVPSVTIRSTPDHLACSSRGRITLCAYPQHEALGKDVLDAASRLDAVARRHGIALPVRRLDEMASDADPPVRETGRGLISLDAADVGTSFVRGRTVRDALTRAWWCPQAYGPSPPKDDPDAGPTAQWLAEEAGLVRPGTFAGSYPRFARLTLAEREQRGRASMRRVSECSVR